MTALSVFRFRCVCKNGWTGELCDRLNCKHGTYLGAVRSMHICRCDTGWIGELCDECFPGKMGPNCDLDKPRRMIQIRPPETKPDWRENEDKRAGTRKKFPLIGFLLTCAAIVCGKFSDYMFEDLFCLDCPIFQWSLWGSTECMEPRGVPLFEVTTSNQPRQRAIVN